MLTAQRALLLRPRRQGWRELFNGAALPSRFTVLRGTPTVASGQVVAATLVEDGYNLVTNPEFTTNTTGWSDYRVSNVRVDSETDPGANSGGTDKWAAKVTKTTADAACQFYQSLVTVVGAKYAISARAYAPSANTGVRNASMDLATVTAILRVVNEDVWETLSGSGIAIATPTAFRLMHFGSVTIGDIAYFDKATCQRQSHMAVASAWPNVRITARVKTPAAGVFPFHLTFRGSDGLTYSMLRLSSGTAGNDTEIIERVAGVDTTRAAADRDWAAGTEYEVRIDVKGASIAVYVNGVATVSYAAAIGAGYRNVGYEMLEAGGWKLLDFAAEAL